MTSPRWRNAFVVGTTLLAFSCVVWWVAHVSISVSTSLIVAAMTMTFGVFVCVRHPISLLGGSVQVSGETIPLVACAILYPQLVVPVALLTVFSAPAPSRSVQLLGGSQVLVSAAVTSFVLLALGAPVEDAQGMLTAAAVAGTVFWASSLVQVLAYERIVWQTPVTEFLPPAFGTLLATTVVAVPLVGLVGVAVESVGVIALPMTLVPIAVLQYFHGLYQRKVQLTDELADKAEILARTNLQFAAAMVRALDTRDAYTAGHSAAVAVYTRDIAREMGFDDETIRMAHLSGLLHDIGKIGVPGRVLNKTAPLDDEEYELMKSHAAMGADILGEVDLYADIAILVRYHHERIDGRGYPEGIGGEAIPAISRMISVADTYSAMTTDRPYRDGMPTEKAMSILRECRGTQLDSDFTDAFLRILIVADEAYQRGKQTDFEVEVAKHQAMSQVEAETVRLNDPHPHPAGPVEPDVPMLPAAVDGELVEVELEREAA